MKNRFTKIFIVFLLLVVFSFTCFADFNIANPSMVGFPKLRGQGLIYLKESVFDPTKDRFAAHSSLSAKQLNWNDKGLYIIQFKGKVTDEYKNEVSKYGVELGYYIPEWAFISRATPAIIADVVKLDCVRAVIRYEPAMKISKELKQNDGAILYEKEGKKDAEVQAITFDDSGVERLNNRVANYGATVRNRDKGLLTVKIGRNRLPDLAQDEDIMYIEEIQNYVVLNDQAAGIIGASSAGWNQSLTGYGQVIGIADTGLDTGINNSSMHLDFQGRILGLFAYGRTNDCSDPHGHGTHVAGSLLGDGARSRGQLKGIAYDSRFVFQSLLNASFGLSTPSDITTLFQQAYNNGARIHSNSWGSPINQYTVDANRVDQFIWDHRDMTILFAAGNYGPNYLTICSPATAKNCITVGASENDRSDKGANSDNINQVAGFSSRGFGNPWIYNNNYYGRFKPDIVAPGTWILSTRSSVWAPGQDPNDPNAPFWGNYDQYYAYMGGTSQATPITAGTVSLIRQYYTGVKKITPSASLIKATLINGAVDMGMGYGLGNLDQGWGRVNLANCLSSSSQFDNETLGFTQSGQFRTYYFNVTDVSKPAKFTLVWSDYPATQGAGFDLVNDLDLVITSPSGVVYNGNDFVAPYNDYADWQNNVENVFIQNPESGIYSVTVGVYAINAGTQYYSLVATGVNGPPTIEIRVGYMETPPQNPDLNFVTSSLFTIPPYATDPTFTCTYLYRGAGPDDVHIDVCYPEPFNYRYVEVMDDYGRWHGKGPEDEIYSTATVTVPLLIGTGRIELSYFNRPRYDKWENKVWIVGYPYSKIIYSIGHPDLNSAPQFVGVNNQNVSTGQMLQFSMNATDSEGDNITYWASNLPSGADFNPSTGVFTWTPGSSQTGEYNVRFTACDGYLTKSTDVLITVNE